MGLVVESQKGNVSGEARSKSFNINDDLGNTVEFNWEEWDDVMEVINRLARHKPKEPLDI